MIDIENLLSSISDEDMAKIKSVADSLMNNNEQKQEKPKETPKTPDFPIDMNTVSKIMSVMGQMNKLVTHFGLQPDEQKNAVKTVLDTICETYDENSSR